MGLVDKWAVKSFICESGVGETTPHKTCALPPNEANWISWSFHPALNSSSARSDIFCKQLQEDKDISLDGLDRLHRLARPPLPLEDNVAKVEEEIGWKEVIFGRKRKSEPEMSEYDQQDLETGACYKLTSYSGR